MTQPAHAQGPVPTCVSKSLHPLYPLSYSLPSQQTTCSSRLPRPAKACSLSTPSIATQSSISNARSPRMQPRGSYARRFCTNDKGEQRPSSLSQASTIAAQPSTLETNPDSTTILWRSVMAKKGRISHIPAPTATGSRSTRSESSTLQSDASIISSLSCGPGHAHFRSMVLAPRGIHIDQKNLYVTAFHHFETTPPPEDTPRSLHYKSQEDLSQTTLWLDGTADFIDDLKNEYTVLTFHQNPEAEFADVGQQSLLLKEPRRMNRNIGGKFVPERCLQERLKPSGELWLEPPITQPDKPTRSYSFNIRPDCSYWVSLAGFKSQWRHTVESIVSIHREKQGLLCPYLTVEFKKDASTMAKAIDQVATAGSLTLYNRYFLRKQHLDKIGEGYTEKKWRDVRHYGLTFEGSKFKIWCIEPTIDYADGTWHGCRMEKLSAGDCTADEAAIENLINWINEVHAWGLGVHGPACMFDVKVVLLRSKGAPRTSLTEEELERLHNLE